MPSPFPGMNPYLERAGIFHDFHQRFCTALADDIAPQIEPRYFARLEERLYIHELPTPERQPIGRGDVSLLDRTSPGSPRPGGNVKAPGRGKVQIAVDIVHESYLEIINRESLQVVTVVELLSPTNKYAGPDRTQYLAKRNRILRSAVNLVEIDLLRGGPRLPIEGLTDSAYVVMVSNWDERPDVGLWEIGLREPLPTIPIPLAGEDAPASVDLQALFHRVFDAARYRLYIYEGKPEPALIPEDDAWAQAILAAAGKS